MKMTPSREDIRVRVQSFIDSVAITVWPSMDDIDRELMWDPMSHEELAASAPLADVEGFATCPPGKPPRVDVWFAPDATDKRKAFCVGHELGHMACRVLPADADEETKGDAFGTVAARVTAFMQSLIIEGSLS